MHLAGAALAGGGSAVTAITLFGPQSAPTAGVAFIAASIGGLLPDLDHDHAVPIRELFSLAAAIVPASVLPSLLKSGMAPEWAVLFCAVAYVTIRFGVSEVMKRLTVHRGIFHSLPFMFCAGLATALLLKPFSDRDRLFLGGAVSVGTLAHLVLDEFYAVDFTGKSLKKSFGTALKIWAPSRWSSVACYVVLLVLLVLTAIEFRHLL
jgi:membrane-bound metal-dependent hydrolase YbcI (DUF457 family)